MTLEPRRIWSRPKRTSSLGYRIDPSFTFCGECWYGAQIDTFWTTLGERWICFACGSHGRMDLSNAPERLTEQELDDREERRLEALRAEGDSTCLDRLQMLAG